MQEIPVVPMQEIPVVPAPPPAPFVVQTATGQITGAPTEVYQGALAQRRELRSQLERLEELERAVIELNPDQFVRKSDPGVGGSTTPLSGTPSSSLDTGVHLGQPAVGPTTTSEHTLSSF